MARYEFATLSIRTGTACTELVGSGTRPRADSVLGMYANSWVAVLDARCHPHALEHREKRA